MTPASLPWIEARTREAPPALRERVLAYARTATDPSPAALAVVARQALAVVEAHPGDRSAALDLLAADGLITLALLAQAEAAPDRLDAFATGLIGA